VDTERSIAASARSHPTMALGQPECLPKEAQRDQQLEAVDHIIG
jgi:hypothetical protein